MASLHLKATVRGSRRPLRGQSPGLARQEAWGLLLIHNMVATCDRLRRRGGWDQPEAHTVRPCARPHPRPRRRRHLLPALRASCREHGRPGQSPDRRDHRAAPPPCRTSADIRQDRRRTPQRPYRGSHPHHQHREIESPRMGHYAENLRAVPHTPGVRGTGGRSLTGSADSVPCRAPPRLPTRGPT